MDERTASILGQVAAERELQDRKWGQQDHPDGTGGSVMAELAEVDQQLCDLAANAGRLSWLHILREEVSEALAEAEHGALRHELIQVAAVAVAWIECIDRRAKS